MKIAYDHQAFALQAHGGISRYFAELVQGLHEHGARPTVIAPLHINQHLLRPDISKHVRGTFFPFDFRGRGRLINTYNRLLLPVSWRDGGFDVVHETYYSQVPYGRGRIRVLTIYDMIHELFPQEFADAAGVTAAKRAAIGRADHVFCISGQTRRDAIRLLGLDPERSSVVYLASSLRATPSQDRIVGESGRRFVLYVGHRGGYKNFDTLLYAFASSKVLSREFDLVAFGGAAFTDAERAAIERGGIANRVRRVSGNDSVLQEYYRRASVFVCPSRYEGFGIPPIEAMASGCPVICSNAGSLAEVVGDAAATFEPDDRDRLRALLEEVVGDPRRATQLRQLGLERAALYSWERCAAETLATYQQLATSARIDSLPQTTHIPRNR